MEDTRNNQQSTNTSTELSERENECVSGIQRKTRELCSNQEGLMKTSSGGEYWMTWKNEEYRQYYMQHSNPSTERGNGWLSETTGTRQTHEDSMKASSDGESSHDRYTRFDESNYYSDSASENMHVPRVQALDCCRRNTFKTREDLSTVGVSNEAQYFGYRLLSRTRSNTPEINESPHSSLSSSISNCNEDSVSTASEFSAMQDIIVMFSRMTLGHSALKRARSTSPSSSPSCESKDTQSKRKHF